MGKMMAYMTGTTVFKTNHILNCIIEAMEEQKSFNIIRLGDGDLKFLNTIFTLADKRFTFDEGYDDMPILGGRSVRQGVHYCDIPRLLALYKDACNSADFISGFDAWFAPGFWTKSRKKHVIAIIKRWREIYERVGIKNESYCNPDVSFFLFLNDRPNLIDYLSKHQKKVCLVSSWVGARDKLRKYKIKCDIFQIPRLIPKNETLSPPPREAWHFNVFDDHVQELKSIVKDHDIFLVGAGAVGRGYSMAIKEEGGIAVDVGKMMDYWDRGWVAPRLGKYIKGADDLHVGFTAKGARFKNAL